MPLALAAVLMPDGTLLVLPRAEADRLWGLTEHTPSDSELPYVSGLFEGSDSEQWQLVAIADGRFGLDAPDGDHLVCCPASSSSTGAPDPPLRVLQAGR